MSKAKVLVLGATGQVGGALISLLAKNESVEVIAAARNPEKVKELGVNSVYLDLDNSGTLSTGDLSTTTTATSFAFAGLVPGTFGENLTTAGIDVNAAVATIKKCVIFAMLDL